MSDQLKWSTQADLERNIVCACSEDPERAVLLTDLQADDFVDPAAKAVYKAILVLAIRGTLNLFLVSKWLVDNGQGEYAVVYRNHLANSDAATPTSWVKHWISGLQDAALRRRVKTAAINMGAIADDQNKSVEDLNNVLPTILAKALARAVPKEAVIEKSNLERLAEHLAEQEASAMGISVANATPALSTGINSVDDGMGGGCSGEVIVLAAASSMGKSALMLQIARKWAASGPTYLWTGEMNKAQVSRRSVAQELQQPLKEVRSGHALQVAETRSANLWVDDDREIGIERLCQKIAIFRLQNPGLVAVVIDYLGLLCGNDYKEVSAASRRIKKLAGEISVPILLLCQLKRLGDRPDKRPQMGDLKESGQIENDADKILMLHRPGYYDKRRDQSEATLYIRKYRDGEKDIEIPLTWNGPTVTFSLGVPKQKRSPSSRSHPDTNSSFEPDSVPMEDFAF